MKVIKEFLHNYRMRFFLISLILILFGSLFFPERIYDLYLLPIFLIINLLAGINLISKKIIRLFFVVLFVSAVVAFVLSFLISKPTTINYLKFALFFMFYVVITIEIIMQILKEKNLDLNLIFGVIAGYISLGLVGFFIFMTVEMTNTGSFVGETMDGKTLIQNTDNLLYYSYITLMTIGYGEIVPITKVAQKAAILLGLMGQFYLVIITAVVVGKFINQQLKSR